MNTWKKLTALLLVILLLVVAPAAWATESDGRDVSKLQELIALAQSKDEIIYTSQSWNNLRKVMAVADTALTHGTQLEVDEAAARLASAISQLKEMDYTRIERTIAEAELFIQENGDQWPHLQTALVRARAVFGCGDQATVEKNADNLAATLADCRGGDQDGKPGAGWNWTVFWIVALIVVVAAGVVLAVLLVWKKKDNRNKQVDDVPLVDYDIDDDVV